MDVGRAGTFRGGGGRAARQARRGLPHHPRRRRRRRRPAGDHLMDLHCLPKDRAHRRSLSTEAGGAGADEHRDRSSPARDDVDDGCDGDGDEDGQLTSADELRDIADAFPPGIVHAFGYGSGVFAQHRRSHDLPMLDLIFVVSDPASWHAHNLLRYPQHYSFTARNLLSPSQIARLGGWGGGCYFNPFVDAPYASSTRRPARYCLGELPRREIKYGVISRADLIDDLTEWGRGMYVAGRMHKPTVSLGNPGYRDDEVVECQRSNATSALAASLLLLSSSSSPPSPGGGIEDGGPRLLPLPMSDVFESIANLSYGGDFRMDLVGGVGVEDPDKVRKLVHGGAGGLGGGDGGVGGNGGVGGGAQYRRWVDMYRPPLSALEGMGLAHVTTTGATPAVEWDSSDASAVRRLVGLLPPRLRSLEDDIVSSVVVPATSSRSSSRTSFLATELSKIVAPAVRAQFWKGLLSAGLWRGARYAAAKVAKGGLLR